MEFFDVIYMILVVCVIHLAGLLVQFLISDFDFSGGFSSKKLGSKKSKKKEIEFHE